VANETENLTRSRRRRAALALRLCSADSAGPAADGPVDAVLAAERRARLVAVVSVPPERERQVLVCRYFLDLSEAETAQVLGCPLGSVKSRTSRALTRLSGWARWSPGCGRWAANLTYHPPGTSPWPCSSGLRGGLSGSATCLA
jgi:DNA-directed RNA polymerase specialized sigma24 family protein